VAVPHRGERAARSRRGRATSCASSRTGAAHADARDDPSRNAEQNDLADRARAIVAALSGSQRAALILRIFRHFEYPETRGGLERRLRDGFQHECTCWR